MWTKSRERGAARKYLSGNFKAGHVTPNEHYLSRAGIRGRKRYLFLGIFILIYIITIAHLLVSSENHCTYRFELYSAVMCKIAYLSVVLKLYYHAQRNMPASLVLCHSLFPSLPPSPPPSIPPTHPPSLPLSFLPQSQAHMHHSWCSKIQCQWAAIFQL